MWTLPNILTMLRILILPPLAVLLLWSEEWAVYASFALFALASITDYFDGYLARSMNQMTEFGRFLDPIADKLLIVTVLIMLVGRQDIGGWHIFAALLILIREIFISGLREFLAGQARIVHVTRLAKWKTALQMITLAGFIVYPVLMTNLPELSSLLYGGLWITAFLTIWTGWGYLRSSLSHLSPGKP